MNIFLKKVRRKLLNEIFNLLGKDYVTGQDIVGGYRLIRIGSVYGGWNVPIEYLNNRSIIYCVGCGEDITFDLGLIEILNCTVYGFDPTPRSIEFVKKAIEGEPNYVFQQIGVWDCKDTLAFYSPANEKHVSHSLVNLQKTNDHIEVEVDSLVNIMANLGHQKVDLLKLDIEGAEYKVIDSMLSAVISPAVLCVEYDEYYHPLDANYKHRIRQSVTSLIESGYELVHSERNGNYTFLNTSQFSK